jgi:hypothetical protein
MPYGHGRDQRFNTIDLAVYDFEEFRDKRRIRLVERPIHFVFGGVVPLDGPRESGYAGDP